MPEEYVKFDLTDMKNFEYDMKRCVRCKGCKWVDHIYMPGATYSTRCPSEKRYLFDSFSAWGRLRLALSLLNGRIEFNDRFVEAIYKCQLCGACDAGCKRNLDLEIGSALESLRIKCVADGFGPMPEHKAIAEKIEKEHNVFGGPADNRDKWAKGIQTDDKAEFVYFVGCYGSYKMQGIPKATANILKATGQSFKIMGSDEYCCGYPLYSTGQIEKAKKAAQHNIDTIAKSGAKTVITACAECYKTLKVDYPKMFNKSTSDMGYQVIHLVEFVADQMEKGTIKFKNNIDMRVTYHDACNLARMSEPWVYWEGKRKLYGITEPTAPRRKGTHGVYHQPRNILKAIPGIDYVDMIRIRENAWCCGAGGGVAEAFPEFAQWSAEERLEEVDEVGAAALITACPRCKDNFSKAINASGDNIKVMDIAEMINEAIK
ncbi:CoB--CoM heterodisulfide reductase iron-sulfur subunit D family protein [uncultured Desulfobacterium sp.]|uniref:CoB--CoM heterodisulfide reductase iron-sulfur subunit D family protein n=1 Tax=uncultured Desulfobacterium sp. TaxID=201089 RepID=A0A445MTV9_9BACT|nr:CoB--CoM heterodisulfide reductase iron-sulfur subunit D family protein [uncultured Desulfobacterium sp.]